MPFEMATNRTSMLILEKGRSHFPLKSTVWRKKSSGSMFDLSLQAVKSKTERREVIIEPITPYKTNSSWLMVTSQAMSAVRKGTAWIFLESAYRASAGVLQD